MRRASLGLHSLILFAVSRAVGLSPEAVQRGLAATLAPYAQYDDVSDNEDFELTATAGGGGSPGQEFAVTSGTPLLLYCPTAMLGYPLVDFELVFAGDAANAADNIAGTVRVSGLRDGVTVDSVISGGRCKVRVTGESTSVWHTGITITISLLGSGVAYRMAVVAPTWVSGNEGWSEAMSGYIDAAEGAQPELAATMDGLDKRFGFQGLREGGRPPVASMAQAQKFGARSGPSRQGRLGSALRESLGGVGQTLFGNRTPVSR